MTQYPGYQNPYLTQPPANPRPTSVTVVVIIGIIWGVLMLLCNGIGMASLFIPANFAGPNPAAEELRSNAVAHGWNIAHPLIGFFLAFTLLAGCAGALALRSWGRKAMNLFAVLEIPIAIAQAVITMLVINPIISRNLQAMTGGAGGGGAGAPSMQTMAVLQHGTAIVTVVLAVGFPVVILMVMNSQKVKAAFDSKRPGVDAAPGQYSTPPQGSYSPPTQ